jgi:hypothetical protein
MREEFEEIIYLEENDDQDANEGFSKEAASLWHRESQLSLECGKPVKDRWCAPKPFEVKLNTGDTRIIQQTGPNSHQDILEMGDKAELEVWVPGGTSTFRSPDGVRVRWDDGNVEVTLPDGTMFRPQGAFTVMINGTAVMTVNYNDGRTGITRPNGHVVTFDKDGLVGVSSQNGGVINHVNLRAPVKVMGKEGKN